MDGKPMYDVVNVTGAIKRRLQFGRGLPRVRDVEPYRSIGGLRSDPHDYVVHLTRPPRTLEDCNRIAAKVPFTISQEPHCDYWWFVVNVPPETDFVAAETDRLIAQATALHGQTKRVVALTSEERTLLRVALLNLGNTSRMYAAGSDGEARLEALYDKLNAGVEAGE